jgi:hypothetical protein
MSGFASLGRFGMTMRYLPAADRAATGWRNGGGVTREVAISRDDGPGVGFHWRISVADVDGDGPFSAFPGCHRVITVLRGAGMALTVDGLTRLVDHRYEPFEFDGAAPTECRLLGGPVVDLNVIHRHDQPVTVEISREAVALGPIERAVVIALDSPLVVRASGARLDLRTLDAADVTAVSSLAVDGGPVAVVRLDSRTH